MTTEVDGYSRWCRARGASHAHCPLACEHPQPFLVIQNGEREEKLICGRCWFVDGVVTECVPCDEDNC